MAQPVIRHSVTAETRVRPRPFYVRFVMEEVAKGLVFVLVLRFSRPVSSHQRSVLLLSYMLLLPERKKWAKPEIPLKRMFFEKLWISG